MVYPGRHHDVHDERDVRDDDVRDDRYQDPDVRDDRYQDADTNVRDRRDDRYAGRHGWHERDVKDYHEEQRDLFGGIRWGAAFFGWLVAMGVAVVVMAILAAAGLALGLTDQLPSGEPVPSPSNGT